jgi:tetratricopeptide (TPR) repeat protein
MGRSATKDRHRTFGLPTTTIRVLENSGYIHASSGDKLAYSFQDLLLLRTIRALHRAHVPTRTINRTLKQLRPWLKESNGPIGRLVPDTLASGIRVQEGGSSWVPSSGQYALPLEDIGEKARVVPITSHENSMKKKHTAAHAHYLRGTSLEEDDARAAREAYEACLKGDCSHLEARINLGRLLHLEGKLREAERVYLDTEEPSAILYFNLGVLLEDLRRELDAIEAYRKAILHDPGLADAHFNLSALHERLGDAQAAFRHLLAYRRLLHAQGSKPSNRGRRQ